MKPTKTEWQQAWNAWLDYTQTLDARAKLINSERHEKGWKLAASVGIDRNMCCVHNASIDDAMTGWCKGNPERLRVAKMAVRYLNEFRASRVANRMSQLAYPRQNT